ncbi:hypothetical protein RJ55_00824 [Drechmeria coniospora]|nr:hypothetical protein RJ55_00824 [Drechmeria coniospora]
MVSSLKNQQQDDIQPPPSKLTLGSLNRAHLADPASASDSGHSSASLAQISEIVADSKIDDTETYGVCEPRDGFFDGLFLKPSAVSEGDLLEQSKDTLPAAFDKPSPLAPREFFPRQLHEMRSLFSRVFTTRAGLRLLKTCAAYFGAYILCLVPVVRDWLGRYHYFMAVSVILNHPARPLGAQIDGAVLTILGTACGIGWGALGLLLSTSTSPAQAGYGGILALFLVLFMTVIAWMRSFFNRSHQMALCAGIAVTFATLAETSSRDIMWTRLLSYSVPWVLGQVLALLVNGLVFPDAGARALAVTFHNSFSTIQEALIIPRPRDNRLRRRLALAFVDLSQAARDFRLDITVTHFRPADVVELRNLAQSVIRALLSLQTETYLFKNLKGDAADVIITVDATSSASIASGLGSRPSRHDISCKVTTELAWPTKELLSCMTEGLLRCEAALMNLSGYRRHLGPPLDVSSDLAPIQRRIEQVKVEFDAAESQLLDSGELPASSMQDAEIVQLFVFARHVRETATHVEQLMTKVETMMQTKSRLRVHLPSYPLRKAVHRTNAQVRHDRGSITAGSYQITFVEIARLLDGIKSIEHNPLPRGDDDAGESYLKVQDSHATMDAHRDGDSSPKRKKLRYRLWRVLYRLQGFESRYAFKVCLVTALLSVPSYLDTSWWNEYEAWWAVSMSWIAMHPRIGGNLQDLVVRASTAILGAVWSGAAYAAGSGDPYVMAAFAAVYMIPMLYRFTQSAHPRSGLVGCLSFTVISLGLQANGADNSPVLVSVLSGIPFLVGTTAPIIVNWVLWPFVARHELRYALSSMLFFMSVIYRSVVARYVYFNEGKEPTREEVARSEMLEGRLREGFLRIRQLLVLTRKEMRLRAPFDPLPYSSLADACERFFEYLIAVRHSALFYNPGYIRDNPVAAAQLLSYRRDAVASILGNLYILAGALRSQRKVPRYLSSAAAARKRLLVKAVQVEEEMSKTAEESDIRWHKKWSDIYSYSYNESLTGCVAQLEELERFTKLIVGEQSFDDQFKDDEGTDEEDNGQGHGHD